MKQLLSAIILAIALLGSAEAAETLTVTIVGTEATTSTLRNIVPGFSTGQTNAPAICIASDPTVNCTGSATESGYTLRPRAYEYPVEGATLALRLPDQRIVTVTCAFQSAFNGGARSCRRPGPMITTLEAKLSGNKAKLIWPIGMDGKRTESETYTVIHIDASRVTTLPSQRGQIPDTITPPKACVEGARHSGDAARWRLVTRLCGLGS